MLSDENSLMKGAQADSIIEADIELQMSKEEFMGFMKTPIKGKKAKRPNTLDLGQVEQTQELPESFRYDECIPDMMSQEEMEPKPYHKENNDIMENCCFEYREGNEVSCTSRLDLDSPLNYAVVPEHVANHVISVQVPLLNIYSMELDVETFPKVNHFEYVPFNSEKLPKLKKTALRKFGMCPMSYYLNEECILLNYKKYLWCQHGYMDHPVYKILLGYSFMILPIVGDPERVKREMKLRDPKGSMKNLLNSPDINCESCESFNCVCKDKMIPEGYIWCIHGLTNKPGQPGQPTDNKVVYGWKTEKYKAEVALNRQLIEETVVIDSTLFEQLEPQTYRICNHNYVNGKNPKNNLIQVCPIGNASCDVQCCMGLCLRQYCMSLTTLEKDVVMIGRKHQKP